MQLYLGDCLEKMGELDDGSVDLILADPPYGNFTACKWDSIIPLDAMWQHLKRIIKPNGAIVLFASQPFTTTLISSNRSQFKYIWTWKKSKPNQWQHSKNRPMTIIEDVCVFSAAPMGHRSLLGDRRMVYFPQGIKASGTKKIDAKKHGRTMGARPNQVGREYESYTGLPTNFLEFKNIGGKKAIHPTQKPVPLLEYLIKTYTIETETVLDFCMGSGSTGVAAKLQNRDFIGIEKEEEYYNIAQKRIATSGE